MSQSITSIQNTTCSIVGFCLVILLTSSGCGWGKPKYQLIPVTGQAKMDGEPIVGLRIDLESMDGLRAGATTTVDGKFEITTSEHGAGVPAGVYTVKVRGDKVPRVYQELGVTLIEIQPGSNPPLELALNSKATMKDAPNNQEAE